METVKRWFVTGIGTGIGKTIVSAVLAEHLKADYWKPIQSGDLEQSDSMTIRNAVSYSIRIHPERYQLNTAVSPHQAAEMDNIYMRVSDFSVPESDNHLIVEGAGGLFVPINSKEFMIDLIAKLDLALVVVVRDYLGCINHTILTLQAIVQRKLRVAVVVFNGDFNPWTYAVLLDNIPQNIPFIHVPTLKQVDKQHVKQCADSIGLCDKAQGV
ncbi:dethiobiotin synthase [Sphingobacterium deserti]|uniref:ATP-dependent dethiobiotin synthetase BioD n=1 Tax=Sphingobacterium deserti TaxID=1229276 RepID=A0A0B8TAG1_9SPHI|nr:dethiobiotin synthase [Sphingobacterium deserti]KGE15839.1 dethiobiotin synthase [Sphingobacterium deserti]